MMAAAARAVAQNTARRQIVNFNENMEYRRLGKTGLMLSAVCLGGHWKRIHTVVPSAAPNSACCGQQDTDNLSNPEFIKNRHEVVSRCIELGINYVDACSPQEILAYSKVLKGRRDKMYFGYSWHTREPRYTEWRSAKKLVEGLDAGLKEAGLDYVDVWRISLPMERVADLGELLRVEEATVQGLELAKKQGKARFTGVSTHNRVWLKSIIEDYPKQIEVVLFPYTADSKELPNDSVFEAIKRQEVGVFGIKPFADRALFKGDSSLKSPTAGEDDRLARMAIRYVLANPAITAPIPGLINMHQVENVARAIAERRKLDREERSELDRAATRMWARIHPSHAWLRNWEFV
jgi:aryl-alcohol dehydrogenase-like predicted oxidoreductase